MNKILTGPIFCSVMVCLIPFGTLGAQEPSTTARPRMIRAEAALTSVTACVAAIDYPNREVTLKGPLGKEVTFTVDPQVKRLKEVKVGDLVHADYYTSVAAEVRKPTSKEAKEPLVVLSGSAKAGPGAPPAAGALRRFKVVTTIEGLDRPNRTITVKGPRGNYLTAQVADPARLTKVRIGDHVVITYTEALAISLERVKQARDESVAGSQ